MEIILLINLFICFIYYFFKVSPIWLQTITGKVVSETDMESSQRRSESTEKTSYKVNIHVLKKEIKFTLYVNLFIYLFINSLF